MADDGLVGRPALELAELVRRRRVSPLEVLDAHLAQVDRLEPRVHAFLAVRAERAREEARALGDAKDLADLPLAGVPIAVKDSVDVAGEPTRLGSLATSAAPAERDDELTRRMRAAGAVVIGKTSQPELAIWGMGESSLGVVRNPWNLERTTGGSSSGSGAAVAAAMVPIAQGSDGGGSIRIPAGLCGLVGIKPGGGVVPVAGGLPEHWFGLSEWGPLATTVADAAMLLDVLAGTERYRDPAPPGRPLRIALSLRSPAAGTRATREVRAAVEAGVDALRGAGHTVIVTDPPYSTKLSLLFLHRFFAGIAAEADLLDLPVERLEPRTQAMVRLGRWLNRNRPVPAGGTDAWRARMAAFFRDHDVLITPTTAKPAIHADGWAGRTWPSTLLEQTYFVPFTQAWNVAGLPAASVPAGLSADGLPIGMQLVAPAGGEGLILSLARQLEDLRPWPRQAPLAGMA
ncbi:MAG TPA: amidase family protein [Candidatus Dormibacteraeota bacterium]|jgi:amidase|nr:amidase family protein [Candidatus Dormibacteraeota bacterium]